MKTIIYRSKTLGLLVMKMSLTQSVKAITKYTKKKKPAVANVELIKNARSLDTGMPNLLPNLVSVPNHSCSIL